MTDGRATADSATAANTMHRPSRVPVMPYMAAALLSAGLMAYALTRAFVWDEGFHLVAAQMIGAGKRPYLDFCFPQTPLNAYWNAAWMKLLGSRWQVTHFAASLLIGASLFLLAGWVSCIFRESRWRSACATTAVLLMGADLTLIQFGPIAQAYAMCMFCSLLSFLLLVRGLHSRGLLFTFGAGVFAGIAAGASLLSAPVGVVSAIWLALTSGAETRWRRLLLYIGGCVIPFVPVLWLFVQGPRQTWFNVVQYQALFRRVDWGNSTEHDLDVLTSWVDPGTTLMLVFLLLAGAAAVVKGWSAASLHRRELLLCIWTSLGLIVYISTAHPTFARYYVVGIPFFSILGAVGFAWAAERLFEGANPVWPTLGLAFVLVLGALHFLYEDRDSTDWRQYEKIAGKIKAVTPPGGVLFADEHVYFLLHSIPPEGMEFSYSHKLSLSAAQEQRLHIVSERELRQQLSAGRFAVFESCNEDRIDKWQIEQIYTQRTDFDDCAVFWDRKKSR